MATRSEHSRRELPRMTFWGHVEALRGVILKAGLVVMAFTVVFFIAMPWIFDRIILAPCHADFPLYRFLADLSVGGSGWGGLMPDFSNEGFHVSLINIRLASQFFIHMSTSFWLGVVFAFPVIIYLVWGFIAPALYDDERRAPVRVFVAGNIMFYLGVAVGYFIVFPLTLHFLAEYKVSEMVHNQISLDSYMDNFLVLILVMGLIFELPILAWMLGRMGLLTRSVFSTYRRHAIAALLILAAVITPTGDPFTLMVVFLPIYALWELSAWLVPKGADESDTDDSDGVSGGKDGSDATSSRTFDDLYVPLYRSKSSGTEEKH